MEGGALVADDGPVPESPAWDPLHAVAATSSTAIATHLTGSTLEPGRHTACSDG